MPATALLAGLQRFALAGTALLVLSGCVTTPTPPATPTVQQAVLQPGPAHEPESIAPATRGPRVRPMALRDTMALRALNPQGVQALIGPPSFVRQDGGATIWQYHAQGCVMDLFWYASDSGLSLLHVEARDIRSPRTAEMQVCLDDLWQSRSQLAES